MSNSGALNAPTFLRLLGEWHGPGLAYLQLAESIQVMVRDGRLSHGIRIPAERELAQYARISRNTVSAAYDILRAGGYVTSMRGSGTYITVPETSADRVVSWVPPASSPGTIDLMLAALPAPEPLLSEIAAQALADLPKYSASHGYDLAGLPDLRETVASCYRDRGLATSADSIMITSGVHHAWGLLVRLLVPRNSHVVMENPTYPNAIDAVRAIGGRLIGAGLGPGGWDMELTTAVLRKAGPPAALFTPDFQNPTGHVMPGHLREMLVSACRDVVIVADESLTGLALDEPAAQPIPMASFGRSVISMGSLSKTFWAGLRIGWIRASREVICRLTTLRAAIDGGNPVIDQLIALHALSRQAEILRARRAMLRERRAAAVAALGQWLPEVRFTLPGGGLSLWVDLGLPISTRMSVLAPEHGVQMIPGKRFSINGTHESFTRIPFVLSPAELSEGIQRLAAAYRQAAE